MTLAASVMALARRQAESLLDEARMAAATLQRQAIEHGRETGRAEARQAVLSQHLEWSTRTRCDLEAEFDRRFGAWCHEVERPLLELALDVARVVIGEAVEGRSVALATERIRAALHQMGDAARASAFTCVEDRTAIETALRDGGLDVSVVGDVSVEPGFCRVETAQGTTDARLEVQMQRIRDEIERS